jgi:hypothetical protein
MRERERNSERERASERESERESERAREREREKRERESTIYPFDMKACKNMSSIIFRAEKAINWCSLPTYNSI